jgi:hypothetical protein
MYKLQIQIPLSDQIPDQWWFGLNAIPEQRSVKGTKKNAHKEIRAKLIGHTTFKYIPIFWKFILQSGFIYGIWKPYRQVD